MARLDPIVFRELPVIQKIIADEMWFEGERSGCPVSAEDPVVRENVCAVILRIGAELRAKLEAQLAVDPPPAMVEAPPTFRRDEAA